jgi:hypothetical protein
LNKITLTYQELYELLASAAQKAIEVPRPFAKPDIAHIEDVSHDVASKIVYKVFKAQPTEYVPVYNPEFDYKTQDDRL